MCTIQLSKEEIGRIFFIAQRAERIELTATETPDGTKVMLQKLTHRKDEPWRPVGVPIQISPRTDWIKDIRERIARKMARRVDHKSYRSLQTLLGRKIAPDATPSSGSGRDG